ncbi:uncharacterized protein H6S33_000918 [Morchella sextelata]|nr:uncharacterized protein H6S33_000918 [Morchella sextelata]KAH0615282.1 hypothetical protein H6S33_000918 [Morchella sextelata]
MHASTILSFFLLALTATASPLLSPPAKAEPAPAVTASGNDGSGNQDVGNAGQNAGNSAANKGTVRGDYTVEQGVQTCGNAQLNCCNKIEKQGDTKNAGLLGSVFGSGDIGLQCTPINLPIAALQVPVNKACDAKAACCQGDTTQNGLINLGCIALASLI